MPTIDVSIKLSGLASDTSPTRGASTNVVGENMRRSDEAHRMDVDLMPKSGLTSRIAADQGCTNHVMVLWISILWVLDEGLRHIFYEICQLGRSIWTFPGSHSLYQLSTSLSSLELSLKARDL